MTPDQYTNQIFMLPVSHGHELWVHDWANKDAKTVFFFMHGGPGGSCKDKHKQPFNPKTQRVIFHDQRGSGQSMPKGRWHHNTTQDLASDITTIADKLGIKKFVITGNSWGSTLSLYYAINNPNRVKAVVVGGVWTSSRAEDAYMNDGGWRTHFPDLWQWYASTVPKKYAEHPSDYHFERAFGKDPIAATESIQIFGDMEAGLISLNDRHIPTPAKDFDPTGMFIEMRYMAKHCFMPDRYIFKNATKLTMPLYIVQGRYDFVCPPTTAFQLSQLVNDSSLTMVQAGHSAEHESVTAFQLIYKNLTK